MSGTGATVSCLIAAAAAAAADDDDDDVLTICCCVGVDRPYRTPQGAPAALA